MNGNAIIPPEQINIELLYNILKSHDIKSDEPTDNFIIFHSQFFPHILACKEEKSTPTIKFLTIININQPLLDNQANELADFLNRYKFGHVSIGGAGNKMVSVMKVMDTASGLTQHNIIAASKVFIFLCEEIARKLLDGDLL